MSIVWKRVEFAFVSAKQLTFSGCGSCLYGFINPSPAAQQGMCPSVGMLRTPAHAQQIGVPRTPLHAKQSGGN